LIEDIIREWNFTPESENPFPFELILINNGSTDDSESQLRVASEGKPWIRVISLKQNVGYGGGVYQGLKAVSSAITHVGWIPADHQYSLKDVRKVWQAALDEPMSLHKGKRTTRFDGAETQWVSRIYTWLSQKILNLKVEDVNGLPKIAPLFMIKKIAFPLQTTFLLDGQMCLIAQKLGVPIREHAVTFHARRAGVSSWSGKRLRVYQQTLKDMLVMRLQSKSWFA
jgi:glycosyltransferase involved in cell wall biosynthesis